MAVMPYILLDEKMTAPYALLPGDPARLDRIAAHLDQVEELAYNRGVSFLCEDSTRESVLWHYLPDLVNAEYSSCSRRTGRNSESVI